MPQETRNIPLWYGRILISRAIWAWLTSVTDGRTDRHSDSKCLASLRCVAKKRTKNMQIFNCWCKTLVSRQTAAVPDKQSQAYPSLAYIKSSLFLSVAFARRGKRGGIGMATRIFGWTLGWPHFYTLGAHIGLYAWGMGCKMCIV